MKEVVKCGLFAANITKLTLFLSENINLLISASHLVCLVLSNTHIEKQLRGTTWSIIFKCYVNAYIPPLKQIFMGNLIDDGEGN